MTPHIEAKNYDFAKTVLMPGDPLRAQFIAENYLTNVKQVNSVRNMLGYTGEYNGNTISVMGSGMGIPSISIYAYELYNFYGVENIIRVGSCCSYSERLKLYDIILAQGACTNSSFQKNYNLPGTFSAIADFNLLLSAYNSAKNIGIEPVVGNILSSDIFYHDDPDTWKKWQKMNVLAVEMESYALYTIAASLGKKALSILTVSDSIITNEETTSTQRQNSFTQMMEVALNL